MRGWIEKRGSSYRVNIELDRAPDGERKYIRKTLKGVKKKEADAELTKMLHELNTGVYIEPSKLTFSEYLDRWLPSHSKTKLSPMSTDRYRREIENRIKPVLGHILLEKLVPLTIRNFVDEIEKNGRLNSDKPLSSEMIRYDLKIVKAALKQAVLWGLIPRNPAANISAPRATGKKEMRILTEEQIKDLLGTLKTGKNFQRYVLILLLISTGLRLGEALALTWDDIDIKGMKEGVITVNKTIQRVGKEILIKPPKTESSNRKVPIDGEVAAALKRHHIKQKEKRFALGDKWKGTGDHVFTGPTGGLVVNSTVDEWWIKHRKLHGLDGVRIHDLRHTHATHLLASGKIDIDHSRQARPQKRSHDFKYILSCITSETERGRNSTESPLVLIKSGLNARVIFCPSLLVFETFCSQNTPILLVPLRYYMNTIIALSGSP